MNRRLMLTGFTMLVAVFLAPIKAHSAARLSFTDAAFDAAQAAGRPILVDVFASWCPTCRAQKLTIDGMAEDPRMKEVVFFTVDFDNQKDVLRRLGVRSQSTLIVFNGRDERGRATGITDPTQIRDLLLRAL